MTDRPRPARRQAWRDPVPGYWEQVLSGVTLSAALLPCVIAAVVVMISTLAEPTKVLAHFAGAVPVAIISSLIAALFIAFASLLLSLLVRALCPGPREPASEFWLAGFFGGMTAFVASSILLSPTYAVSSGDSPVIYIATLMATVLIGVATLSGQVGGLWGAMAAYRENGLLCKLLGEAPPPRFNLQFLIRVTLLTSVVLTVLKLIHFPLGPLLAITAIWLPLQWVSLRVLLRRYKRRIPLCLNRCEVAAAAATKNM